MKSSSCWPSTSSCNFFGLLIALQILVLWVLVQFFFFDFLCYFFSLQFLCLFVRFYFPCLCCWCFSPHLTLLAVSPSWAAAPIPLTECSHGPGAMHGPAVGVQRFTGNCSWYCQIPSHKYSAVAQPPANKRMPVSTHYGQRHYRNFQPLSIWEVKTGVSV